MQPNKKVKLESTVPLSNTNASKQMPTFNFPQPVPSMGNVFNFFPTQSQIFKAEKSPDNRFKK